MNNIAWDYEESVTNYYHIYGLSDAGDKILGDGVITFNLPQNKNNDNLIFQVVGLLNELAENLLQSTLVIDGQCKIEEACDD